MSHGGVPSGGEKKKLSPWVWVGVGCLGILVVGGVVTVLLGAFLFGKAKEVADEMREDPVAVTSRWIAAANPEIELVQADKDARTVVFRNVETGEEFTIAYEDIEQGRFSLSSGDESATIDFDADEGENARMTVTTDEGTTTFRADAEVEDLPDWLPQYPGSSPQGTYSSETAEMRAGSFGFETNDELDGLVEFYVTELEGAGLEIRSRTTTSEGAVLVAGSADDTRAATVTVAKSRSKLEVVVNFMEKN